jgi:hypothetical protein
MTDRIALLAEEATNERERLSEAFESLEQELGELTDWRRMVRRDPVVPLALALGTGLLVGIASRPAPRSRSRQTSPSSDARGSKSSREPARHSVISDLAADTWREVKTMAIPLIAGRLIGMLSKSQRR